MQKFFVFLSIFLFSACSSGTFSNISWDKSAFYEVNVANKKVFFEYPVEALLRSDYLEYQGCKVNFKPKVVFEEKFEKVKSGDIDFEVWYENGRLWRYHAFVKDFNYSFYVEDAEKDLGYCINFVERLAKSMSANKLFTSDRFDFSLAFPDGYEVEYLDGGTGLLLSKVSVDDAAVKAEIRVEPMKNESNYDDFKEFVAEKYQGFTMEFRTYDGVSGVFVDEWKEGKAIRHFFTMLPGEDYLFAANLTVKSANFAEFQNDFDRMIEGVRIF